MSLTTDPNDPNLKVVEPSGQHKTYLVLSDEERAKGFVRPVRRSYKHVGRVPHYKGIHRYLGDAERAQYPGKGYVAIMTVLTHNDGSFSGGAYVTQREIDAWQNGTPFGGCGAVTTMGTALAETYARDPKFYGATFCVACGKHLPIGEYGEFVWEGTDERVGS